MIISFKSNKSKPITFSDGSSILLYPLKRNYEIDDKYKDDDVIKKLIEDNIIKIILEKKEEKKKSNKKSSFKKEG